MADDTVEPLELPGGLEFDSLITVRYDDTEGRPIYDLGSTDPWAAVTMLRAVADAVEGWLALPRNIDDPPDEEDDDGD